VRWVSFWSLRTSELLPMILVGDHLTNIYSNLTLDDLPLVSREDNKLANCTWGKIEDRDPIFQAPEERLHHTSIPNPFDEKADVWKLANMTYTIMYRVWVRLRISFNLFFQSVSPSKKDGIDELMAPLEGFLGRCQAQNPEDRPTATEMVIELIEQYKKAANFLW